MQKNLIYFLLASILVCSCSGFDSSATKLSTENFQLSIDAEGLITEFTDLTKQINYIDVDSVTALMSLRVNKQIMLPQSAEVQNDLILLNFAGDIKAEIQMKEKDKYLTFELISLSNHKEVSDYLGTILYHN